MHPLANQLKHKAFPALANALRKRAIAIADSWMEVVRQVIPRMDCLTVTEMRDSIPEVLEAIAAALESDHLEDIADLLKQASKHGFERFLTAQSLLDLFEEQRLLRGVIVVEVEKEVDHQIQIPESAALHATIDIMLQQSILAMVDKQKEQLREAAEAEVKFIAFLSHDLQNNLLAIHFALDHIRQQVRQRPEGNISLESLTDAQDAIQKTISGMKRLLEHERLRKSGAKPNLKPLNVLDIANRIAKQFHNDAQRKGINIEIKSQQPAEETSFETDEELISLILQNIVGNAVKFAERGKVEIVINRVQPDAHQPGRFMIAVHDQGPGIDPKHHKDIFEAFKRGEAFGHEGVGLGLAIASQAARLLDGQLEVESRRGLDSGSTFSVSLPARR
jgi:signal transduction histidine kinase